MQKVYRRDLDLPTYLSPHVMLWVSGRGAAFPIGERAIPVVEASCPEHNGSYAWGCNQKPPPKIRYHEGGASSLFVGIKTHLNSTHAALWVSHKCREQSRHIGKGFGNVVSPWPAVWIRIHRTHQNQPTHAVLYLLTVQRTENRQVPDYPIMADKNTRLAAMSGVLKL